MNWISTDPSCKQFGRKIGNNVYEFKQERAYPDGFVVEEYDVVDLNDWSDAEIDDHLSAYGWSIKQLREENSEADAEWLMAECIFEQTV